MSIYLIDKWISTLGIYIYVLKPFRWWNQWVSGWKLIASWSLLILLTQRDFKLQRDTHRACSYKSSFDSDGTWGWHHEIHDTSSFVNHHPPGPPFLVYGRLICRSCPQSNHLRPYAFKRYLINYLHCALSLCCSCSTKQLLVIWIGKLCAPLSTIAPKSSPMLFWFINRCWCDFLDVSVLSLWIIYMICFLFGYGSL